MNFEIPARIEDYRARIADFIEREVLPLEADAASYDAHENIALPLLQTLRAKARAQGLWCLQLKPETGGAGLDKRGMAVCYEEMNRSIFGPAAFIRQRPDDGHHDWFWRMARRRRRRQRWLKPIVDGAVRSPS